MGQRGCFGAIALGLLLGCGPAGAQVPATFLYRLSDFGGPVELNLRNMAPDRERGELLVVDGETIRIFGPSGMAVYEFEHDAEERGSLVDAVPLEGGDILVLSRNWDPKTGDGHPLLTRCDYRGRPGASTEITGLPEALAGFVPDVIRSRGGRLFLVSLSRCQVVEIDTAGRFVESWDLAGALGRGESSVTDLEIAGFDVDSAGRFYVSLPVIGLGFRIAPDGTAESFGESGAGQGTMGVAKGIAVTDRGWVLVADILNQLVMVFDEQLRFVGDFPHAPRGHERLAGPVALAVDGDRVYVGEIGDRGVAVFRLGGR
jgi:hypothetical protein